MNLHITYSGYTVYPDPVIHYMKAFSDDGPDIRYIRILVWIIYKHVQYTFRIYGISGVFLWMIYDHLQVIDLFVVNIFRIYGISGSFHHCITFFED